MSIATFLKIKGADKTAYWVKGVLAETIRQEELIFLLRDDSGDLVFKLSDDGPEAAMAFRSSEIVPGDTLTITEMRKRLFMKGEKTRVGCFLAQWSTIWKAPIMPNWPRIGVLLFADAG